MSAIVSLIAFGLTTFSIFLAEKADADGAFSWRSGMFKKLSLARTGCYGTCPAYQVSVDSIGNVTFQGEMFVYKRGIFIWKINEERVKQLNDLLNDFCFREYVYKTPEDFATDNPSCIMNVIFSDGFEKEIDHYHGDYFSGIERLNLLEKSINRIIGTRKHISPVLKTFQIKVMCKDISGLHQYSYFIVASCEKDAFCLVRSEIEEICESKYFEIQVLTHGRVTNRKYFEAEVIARQNKVLSNQ